MTDGELYRRGVATLVASWAEDARGSAGAALHRLPGVAVAAFPREPERSFFNNALLARDLAAEELGRAVRVMEDAYAEAGISSFAAWVHETDDAAREKLEARGYRVSESTRAMGMELDGREVPELPVELGTVDWREYLRVIEAPPGLLAEADHNAYHVLAVRLDDENAAAGLAFDFEGDCGIFSVGTLAHARRRGLATALTAALLRDARGRGCRTASLQATPMAERLYATLGFRDLGQIVEYAPPRSA